MSARIQVWVKPNEPLKQSAWTAEGFSSLANYIRSLEQESQRGFKSQGLPTDNGDAMPLATFGLIQDTEKIVVMECPDYDMLPNDSLFYGEMPIVLFD